MSSESQVLLKIDFKKIIVHLVVITIIWQVVEFLAAKKKHKWKHFLYIVMVHSKYKLVNFVSMKMI